MRHEPYVSPYAGLDLASLLLKRAETHGERNFLTWAPFDGCGGILEPMPPSPPTRPGWAHGLVRRGVRPGARVMIHLENAPEYLLAWHALARIGAVAVATKRPGKRRGAEAISPAMPASPPRSRNRASQAACGTPAPVSDWLAVTAHDSGDEPAAGDRPSGDERFEALFGDAAKAPAPVGDGRRPLGGSLHLRQHGAAEGRSSGPTTTCCGAARSRRTTKRLTEGRPPTSSHSAAVSRPSPASTRPWRASGPGLKSCSSRASRRAISGQRRVGAPLHLGIAGTLLYPGAAPASRCPNGTGSATGAMPCSIPPSRRISGFRCSAGGGLDRDHHPGNCGRSWPAEARRRHRPAGAGIPAGRAARRWPAGRAGRNGRTAHPRHAGACPCSGNISTIRRRPRSPSTSAATSSPATW